MKKRILQIAAGLLIAVSLGAASVWEGAAGIASVEEFPVPGHYVKSSAFPKNTIVEITNLENGVTVNAIVTDAASSAGVLAVLAPSTAGSLGISGNAITRIRVRVPDGIFDADEFSSSANMMDPDVNPAAAVAMDKARYSGSNTENDIASASPAVIAAPPSALTVPVIVGSTEITELAEIGETQPIETTEAESSQPEILAAVPEPTDASTGISDVPQPIVVPAEPEVVAVEETPVSDSFEPEIAPTDVGAIAAEPEVVAVEETPVSDSFEPEIAPADAGAISAEPELVVVEEMPDSDSFEPEIAPTDAGAISAEPEVVVVEEMPDSDSFEPVIAPADAGAIAAEPEVVVVEEMPDSDSFEPEVVAVEETSEFAGVVVLDPSEPVPPPASAEIPAVSDEPEMVIAEEPKEKVATDVLPPDSSESTLPLVDTLDPSSYYIQITVLSDKVRTQKLVDTYKSYPLAVQELQRNGKTLYRVLIGPTALDEYGATLERFKKLGFSDAFVASSRR